MAIKASLTMNWSLTKDHAFALEKSQNSEGSRFATKKVTLLLSHDWTRFVEKKEEKNAEENPKLKLS